MVERCIYCGKETPDRRTYHDECRADYERQKGTAVTLTSSVVAPAGPPTPGGIIALNVLGAVAMMLGLFFLVVSPNIKPREPASYSIEGPPPEVVNLHKMFLGETFTIVGAVFLAAAWRPRGRA